MLLSRKGPALLLCSMYVPCNSVLPCLESKDKQSPGRRSEGTTVCLCEQYGMHGICALKKTSALQLRQCGSSAFSCESLQKWKKWNYWVSKWQNSIHTLRSAFPQREGRALHPCKKKAGGRQELPRKTQQNCKCQHQNEQGS